MHCRVSRCHSSCDPFIPLREVVGRCSGCRNEDSIAVREGLPNQSRHRGCVTKMNLRKRLRRNRHGVRIAIHPRVRMTSIGNVYEVRLRPKDILLSGHRRPQVQRRHTRHQHHVGVRNSVLGRQLVEPQHRVLAQVHRRRIFELYLHPALARYDARPGLQRQVHPAIYPRRYIALSLLLA